MGEWCPKSDKRQKKLQIKYANEGNVSKIGWAQLCKFEHGTRDTYAFTKYVCLQNFVKTQKTMIKIEGEK